MFFPAIVPGGTGNVNPGFSCRGESFNIGALYAGLISSSPIIGAKAKVKGIGPKDDGIFYRSDNHIIANTAGTGGKDLVK